MLCVFPEFSDCVELSPERSLTESEHGSFTVTMLQLDGKETAVSVRGDVTGTFDVQEAWGVAAKNLHSWRPFFVSLWLLHRSRNPLRPSLITWIKPNKKHTFVYSSSYPKTNVEILNIPDLIPHCKSNLPEHNALYCFLNAKSETPAYSRKEILFYDKEDCGAINCEHSEQYFRL